MQTSPYTAMAAAPGTNYSGLANLMAMQGSGGDNTLVHMSKTELPYLNSLARAAGHPQGLPVNPKTGLPEANILKSILPIAGTILGGMFLPMALPAMLGTGALATGIGAGLGSFAGSMFAGKSFKDAAIGGLLSGGLSGLSAGMLGNQSLMGDPSALPSTTGAIGGQEAIQQSMIQNPALAVQAGPSFDASLADYAQSGLAPGSIIPGRIAPTVGADSFAAADFALQQAPNVATPTPFYTPFTGAGRTVASDTAASLSNIDPSQFVKAQTLAEASPVKFTEEFLTKNVDKYVPTSRLEAVSSLPKEAGYTDMKSLYGLQPGMDKFEYLKYAAKPAVTTGVAGIGMDALTEQGAFKPIDYSDWPTGEENKVSPLALKGLKFESERTGAFPTTEEAALAFAQPGGNRSRFFNQRFTIPANTGGGIRALAIGGPTALEVALGDDGATGIGEGPGPSGAPAGGNSTGGPNSAAEAQGFGSFGFGEGKGTNSGVDPAAAVSLGVGVIGALTGIPGLGPLANLGVQSIQARNNPIYTPNLINPVFRQKQDLENRHELNVEAESVAAADTFGKAVNAINQAMMQETEEDVDLGLGGGEAGASGVGSGAGAPGGPEGEGDTPGGEEGSGAADGGPDGDGSGGSGPGDGGADGADGGAAVEQGGYLRNIINMENGGLLQQSGMGGLSLDQPGTGQATRTIDELVQAGPPPTIDELEEMQNIAVMQQVLAGQSVKAQMGGLVSAFAMGGTPSPYFEGRVVGPGDGMSDSIPFSIENQQPAILSRDEYVLPADIVSMMGNGSSDAGAGKIDSFINDFRVQKYGRGAQPPETSRGLSSIG